jgi:hypothetical protein
MLRARDLHQVRTVRHQWYRNILFVFAQHTTFVCCACVCKPATAETSESFQGFSHRIRAEVSEQHCMSGHKTQSVPAPVQERCSFSGCLAALCIGVVDASGPASIGDHAGNMRCRNKPANYCKCMRGFAGVRCEAMVPWIDMGSNGTAGIDGQRKLTLPTRILPGSNLLPDQWTHALLELAPGTRVVVAEMTRQCALLVPLEFPLIVRRFVLTCCSSSCRAVHCMSLFVAVPPLHRCS